MKKILVASVVAIFILTTYVLYTVNESPQEQAKTYKIGILNYAKVADPSIQGFKKGMEDQGYREGESVEYLYEGPIGDKLELIKAGQRLVDQNVDLIFSPTTPASLAAKKVTEKTGTPVVIGPVSDPIGVGLVKSLMHKEIPRLTGVVFGLQEEKRLEWLLRLAPKTKRIYVPYNENDRSPQNAVKKLRIVAAKLNVQLIEQPIKDINRLSHYIENPPAEADAIYLPTDSLMATNTAKFAKVAIAKKLPLTCPHHPGVKQGALFTFGFQHTSLGKQASRLASQILQGISPGDLPIEHADFYLTLNLLTAEKIGLNLSDEVLRQADTISK